MPNFFTSLFEKKSRGGENLIRRYGDVLGKTDSVIKDSADLPASKMEIKAALLDAISSPAWKEMRDHLEVAYVSLADFQPLSPAEKRAVIGWNDALNSTETEMTVLGVPNKLAQNGEVITALLNAIKAEATASVEELRKKFGAVE